MKRRFRGRVALFLATVAVVGAGALACHEEGDVVVASLAFEGNRAFSDGQLADVILTQAGGKLPWSRTRHFNRSIFDEDLQRLKSFYEDRGYPSARVASVGVDLTPKHDAVRLRVAIDEGTPLLVERVVVNGVDGLPPEITNAIDGLPITPGMPRDRQIVAAAREQLTFVLRDHGYAQGRVASSEAAGSVPDRVIVTFDAAPGPLSHFGAIDVEGVKSVHASVVLRALAFRSGDLYRESRVLESQRRLASLGIFDFAHVGPPPESRAGAGNGSPPAAPQHGSTAAVVPIRATVTEGKPQRLQIGGGFGSEDGPRGSLRWEHLNFLGDARHFSVDTRYSLRLRGVGFEFREPYFLTTKLSLNARIGVWWTAEPTYHSRALGGRVGVTFRSSGQGGNLEAVDHVIRAAYVNDSLSYTINPETLDDLTQFEQLIALGLDPVTGHGRGRVAAIDVDLERTAIDHEVDPRHGHALSLHLKHASPNLGGTFRYVVVLGEARVYVPVGARLVWASRGRAGAVFSKSASDLPFSERYFLGGSSTLRGWGRFQVAPLTPDGLPIGGRAMVDLSTELRFPLKGAFGGVVFVDAGNVWDESTIAGFRDLRVDAGAGLRWKSPIGVVRADVGIQLTRIPGLMILGDPERRHWRVHFSIGHAF